MSAQTDAEVKVLRALAGIVAKLNMPHISDLLNTIADLIASGVIPGA